jgi:hypothetical protein
VVALQKDDAPLGNKRKYPSPRTASDRESNDLAIDRLDAVVWGSRKLASSFNELGGAHALCRPTPHNNVFGASGRLRRPPENTAREALQLEDLAGQGGAEHDRKRFVLAPRRQPLNVM